MSDVLRNLSKTCAVEPKGRDSTLLEGEPFEIDHRGEISGNIDKANISTPCKDSPKFRMLTFALMY